MQNHSPRVSDWDSQPGGKAALVSHKPSRSRGDVLSDIVKETASMYTFLNQLGYSVRAGSNTKLAGLAEGHGFDTTRLKELHNELHIPSQQK